MPIPIIDIFAGPGGLGEGFSQIGWKKGSPFFKIGLSVEKEASAYRTLKLRSFFRQFTYDKIPEEYYEYLREGKKPELLYDIPKYKKQAVAAGREVWQEELRNEPSFYDELDARISSALSGRNDWVLIGGPPCQAYSLAGRVRNKVIKGYTPEKDKRHFLYQEYLRIIEVHKPAVFVMENVKGLLSSKINGNALFDQIISDLKSPFGVDGCKYKVFSLTKRPENYSEPEFEGKDFVIKSEKFGIPQSRHRVILLGVRADICSKEMGPRILTEDREVTSSEVLGLPALRSGISRGKHDGDDWKTAIDSFPLALLKKEICRITNKSVFEEINKTLKVIKEEYPADTGANYVDKKPKDIEDVLLSTWYEDKRVKGVFNHSARTHMISDLHRYLYVSCFAKVNSRSPKMNEIPESLKPKHKNRDSGKFNVRFRVQPSNKPAHTVTSHISKDGHDNIHYEPRQCRSLTVREAARLQTFPDNYYFCGNKTEQYTQVGNAVPPLLANKIAHIVKDLLLSNGYSQCSRQQIEG